MRPILWGTIWFIIGGAGWLAFSMIGGVLGAATGAPGPIMKPFIWFFGLIFYLSLPVAIIAEIIRWIERRKKK